jgi:simple sugar transport system permease protein
MSLLRRVGLALFAPVLAVVVAVVISAAVMAALRVDPLQVFRVMVDFGGTPTQQVTQLVVVLDRAVPLFLSGLAVAIAFRMGLFNIGVEGQYRLATIMAAAVGAAVVLPGPLHVLLVVVVAMAVAAIWASIVAVLKVTRGVSEVISSIMLNFVALGLSSYLLTGPFRGSPEGASIISTREIPASGHVPSLNGLLGALGLANPPRQLYGFLVIAAVVGVLVAVLLGRTRFGFDLRTVGQSESAASASGVSVKKMVATSMIISGAVAGLIGMPTLLNDSYAFSNDFPVGIGFTGIAIALLGRNHPIGIALGALLWGFLERTTNHLEFQGYDKEILGVIQGVIVLCVVIAYEVVRRYGLKRQQQKVGAELAAQAAAPTKKQEVA